MLSTGAFFAAFDTGTTVAIAATAIVEKSIINTLITPKSSAFIPNAEDTK